MQEELYGEDRQSENQRRNNNNMSNERNDNFASPCELGENNAIVATTTSVDNHHPENYYG
jgi:hypothetical protein